MPLTHFYCPDGVRISVTQCLTKKGCRMKDRCCPLPFLRKIGYDRKYTGVSPSAAGNGPRLIGLKATCSYCVDPDDRVFAVLGTTVHGRLAERGITIDVLSEEPLKDKEMQGIADILEEDEYLDNAYILSDYKTSGSFSIAKWLGIKVIKEDVPILDKDGKQVYLKSGPNKGQPKTKKESHIEYVDPGIDIMPVTLQLNRYRIFYERHGFPISKMRIFAIPRDGGTYIAKNRGITFNKNFIPIRRMQDEQVLNYYRKLQAEVSKGFEDEYWRLCQPWECWEGRRCANYCEVASDCQDLCDEFKEKWPGEGKQ